MIVTIEKKEYPFLFSFSAIQEYQTLLEKSTKKSSGNLEDMRIFIRLGLKWGCKFEEIKYDLSDVKIAKWMELNLTEAAKLVKHCTTQFRVFGNAFKAEIEESEKKPKPQMKKAG